MTLPYWWCLSSLSLFMWSFRVAVVYSRKGNFKPRFGTKAWDISRFIRTTTTQYQPRFLPEWRAKLAHLCKMAAKVDGSDGVRNLDCSFYGISFIVKHSQYLCNNEGKSANHIRKSCRMNYARKGLLFYIKLQIKVWQYITVIIRRCFYSSCSDMLYVFSSAINVSVIKGIYLSASYHLYKIGSINFSHYT